MIKVLYITHEYDRILGCSYSLLNLLNSIKGKVEPFILFPCEGIAVDYFRSFNYNCFIIPFRCDAISKNHLVTRFIPRLIYDKIINHKAKIKICDFISRNKIDLIHSNSSIFSIGCEIAQTLGIKHVWHLREFQNLDFDLHPIQGWNKIRRQIAKSDAVIAITKAIKEHYIQKKGANVHVINDAVRSCDDITCTAKKNHLIFCGNINNNKGAEKALDIFAAFHKRHPEYNLLYVGSITNEYKNFLIQKANQYNILNNVFFLGYQSSVKEFIQEARALLMCSKNEAQGRVTVEAMFYGVPVIGLNSGGTREIIYDGKNGFLFNTVEEAVNKIELLCTNESLYNRIIHQGHQTAMENFSEETYGLKIMNIYTDVLRK